jgi:hypothetical protein
MFSSVLLGKSRDDPDAEKELSKIVASACRFAALIYLEVVPGEGRFFVTFVIFCANDLSSCPRH